MLISWDQFGILKSIEPTDTPQAEDLWIAPGLFDVQVNGYVGVDFQRDESVTEDTLLALVHGLRCDGCHRILLTLIASELKRAIVGWHIEGPFLSEERPF
jgi:N-acetylglucosamine-6-phosphate deacetylase